ncbi:MAG: RNA polymerase alpha chain family protein,sigma-70 family protein [Candidatus Wolfebacteria bacterium GW2011_GWA2_42_10]|uniref:RNA polymerase alpha chain family protein,sigma-70 family protein n=1 Tax=Candidatus Wolfebacteria bacterium GW2011_GWA2_42_10 TaxID=1619004 RepID=A0A0G0XJD1_9BACT|nr:MAG: RNA polymerase alpha chain family protein,sigma-70 family protein [Candidatus Wolfebacteria bacterium GW2011_GWA2_42_10]
MAEENLKNILDEIVKTINPRVREVIEKRFGLRTISYQTLEAIGQNMGITRERVRQIEALGLKQLTNKNTLEPIKPVFELIEQYLTTHGGVRSEYYFLKELAELLSLKEKNKENLINFTLALGNGRFVYFKETPNWRSAWALGAAHYNQAIALAGALKEKLASQNLLLQNEALFKTAAGLGNKNLTEQTLKSYVGLCRHISQNPFGEWGLISSPEVSPRGVKDKAYLVFKKEKKPLHFTEVASLINKTVFSDRKAHPQTVHNELIKDARFVLVGRGTYALSDWGYEPGTVRDVLVSILKNSKSGLTREEIVKTVQAKRLVKENTILLNLQNRKVFKKTNDHYFILA